MPSSIGIFDSGFGGLSILKEIVKVLPEYDYIYLGDTARAPYGDKTQDDILNYTEQGVDFLIGRGCDLIILACNSASSEALRKIQQEYIPSRYPTKKVLGVVIPGSEDAVMRTKNRRVGVLATRATVASHAFKREIKKLDRDICVFEVPAPLLVPLIEDGREEGEELSRHLKTYLKKLITSDIDTLILGCTHYGLIRKQISKIIPGVHISSPGAVVAQKLKIYLKRHSEISSRLKHTGKTRFYTTGKKALFDKHGSRFLGSKLRSRQIEL